MHHQYRLSVLQWNRGPERKIPTQTRPEACGHFHPVILQEAGDLAPHVSDQYITHADGNDLWPSFPTKTRSNLALRSSPPPKPPQAKTHGDCCDAPQLLTLPQSRFAQSIFTTKLPRNVTHQPLSWNASKLLWCSTASTSSVVTQTQAPFPRWVTFSRPSVHGSWQCSPVGVGALDESCYIVHPHGELMRTAATSSTTLTLVLHLVTRLRISLSSFISASATSQAPTASCAVLNPSSVAWSVPRPKTTACVNASDLHNKPPRTLWPCNPSPAPRRLPQAEYQYTCAAFQTCPNEMNKLGPHRPVRQEETKRDQDWPKAVFCTKQHQPKRGYVQQDLSQTTQLFYTMQSSGNELGPQGH